MSGPLDDLRRLIVLAPIAPASVGNGLAMRTDLFRRSAPSSLEVLTVVVPVAGRSPEDRPRSSDVANVALDPAIARAGVRSLLGDAVWRDRLSHAGPLPRLARAGSPGLADSVVSEWCGDEPVALHVMRGYLAPLGVAVAERLRPTWVTLDLDEDDAALAANSGALEESAAHDRLLAVFAPFFDGLSAASAAEAGAISERHGLAVDQLPNAVQLPAAASRLNRRQRGAEVRLLFVGNLTYPPNAEAARLLVEMILPRVRQRLGEGACVTLAGAHHPELRRLAGPGVELTGFVSDLSSIYADAAAVVVPLASGGGTRFKLLEAFAHGAPVIASRIAAAGLEVSDGRHLLLAEDPDQVAAAVQAMLSDEALVSHLTAEARALVRDRYSTEVVIPQIREFFARAAVHARDRVQLASSS
jgi:glycosyltransferase involved in cell wall biosynthesis